MDGEIVLQQGLFKFFNNLRFFRCFGYFKRSCGEKFIVFCVFKQFYSVFFGDIFGYNIGSIYYEGLVDLDSEEVFDVKFLLFEVNYYLKVLNVFKQQVNIIFVLCFFFLLVIIVLR